MDELTNQIQEQMAMIEDERKLFESGRWDLDFADEVQAGCVDDMRCHLARIEQTMPRLTAPQQAAIRTRMFLLARFATRVAALQSEEYLGSSRC